MRFEQCPWLRPIRTITRRMSRGRQGPDGAYQEDIKTAQRISSPFPTLDPQPLQWNVPGARGRPPVLPMPGRFCSGSMPGFAHARSLLLGVDARFRLCQVAFARGRPPALHTQGPFCSGSTPGVAYARSLLLGVDPRRRIHKAPLARGRPPASRWFMRNLCLRQAAFSLKPSSFNAPLTE